MSPASILALYLCFFGAELLFENLLTLLNLRSIRHGANEVPGYLAGHIGIERYNTSNSYSRTKNIFSAVNGAISSAAVVAVVVSGFLGIISSWVSGFRLPVGFQGVCFVVFVSLIFHVLALPSRLYSQFVIEEKFGFNKMTAKLFMADEIKGLALSAALGVPILLLLFWFVRAAGSLWWLYAFAAVSAFQLIMSIFYPMVIAPLFNRFTPLEEGSLKEGIQNLADALKFARRGVFVMDGSKRSRHSNAYFTGIGKLKRIVLFDTLVKQLPEKQVVAVLAHEIGHQKRKHIIKGLAVSLVLLLLSLWILDKLLGAHALFQAFGFDSMPVHGMLIILSFCAGPFSFLLTPLFTSWSRRHEFEADRFAAQATGNTEDLKAALLALGIDNLTNLNPHPWFSFFHYSHPTLAERLKALSTVAAG